MIWDLKYLILYAKDHSACINNNKWVSARPLNYTKKYASLLGRIKSAWEVFQCRAEAFKWPEGQ